MDIGTKYLKQRAPDLLAYGRIHTDKKSKHVHLHLMLSANCFESSTRYRISKGSFNAIRRDLEGYVIENYPNLDQKRLHHQSRKRHTKHAEYELIKRKGHSKRTDLTCELDQIFSQTRGTRELLLALLQAGIVAKFRGNQITVMKDGFKARLKTLGLQHHQERFASVIPLMEEVSDRITKLKHTRVQSGFYTNRDDIMERIREPSPTNPLNSPNNTSHLTPDE